MSCKSAIYTANTSANAISLTTAQPTASLPLGTVIRRFGCNAQLSGIGVLIEGQGYYDFDSSVTVTATTAGNYTLSLFKDGVAVPGATQTVTATAASIIVFNIPALIRLQCCSSSSTLTLVLSTNTTLPNTITVNNVAVVVKKI